MKILRDEKGQTLVLTALCGSVLIGFMALALDVGVLYHTRRDAQTAADAAAMAGALDYLYNQSASTAKTAGCTAAGKNGISGNCTTSASDGSCTGTSTQICVNVPPKNGPNTATSGTFVEAIVMVPQSTIFRAGSTPVYARAVAALPTNGQACIWVMAPTGSALDVQGNYDIESPHCGIYVNSSTNDAMGVTGNAGTVNSTFIDVVGSSNLQHQTTPTPATMNSGIRQSPWGNLNGPDSSACSSGNTYSGKTITSSNIPTASNGVVCFTGGTVNNPPVLSGSITLPGANSGIVYYFQNGVEVNTSATVTFGNAIPYNPNTSTFTLPNSGVNPGAVLDVGNGTLKQDSNSILNIYSPTQGSYTGIAIFQPPSNKSTLQVQFGSNNEVLDGYIYAPGGEVYLQDNGGGVTATGIVAYKLYDKASTLTVANSYDKANPTVTLNRVLKLVE